VRPLDQGPLLEASDKRGEERAILAPSLIEWRRRAPDRPSTTVNVSGLGQTTVPVFWEVAKEG